MQASPKKKSFPIVISGPSGSGKTTIIKKILSCPDLIGRIRFSISATTRPPRPGERDGVDYHFLSRDEFNRRIKRDEFIEWADVHDAKYGTLISELDGAEAEGKVLLLELDVQGGSAIKRKFPDALLIFLSVPESVLRTRLEHRPSALPPEKLRHEISLRLRNSLAEMRQAANYDHIVLNENLDETVSRVISIIMAESASRGGEGPA